MKKFLCLLTCLLLLPVVSAMADEADLSRCAIANATVAATHFVDVTAPFSGTLETFDLAAGDRVSAGATLMTMQTSVLYATEDGKVGAVFALNGDDAAAVTQRYGGVIGLEPAALYQLQCTVNGAYDDEKNRTLHLGETLYFKSAKGAKDEGTARVTAVRREGYVAEVLTGRFEMGESLRLYRNDKYENRECVGRGTIIRRDDVVLPAAGRVSSVMVAAGDTVAAGQPLMTMMAADAAPSAMPEIFSPADGVLSAVYAMPGQQVWKGQALCRIELDAEIEVVADADEMDLGGLTVGSTVPVTLDTDEKHLITGTVTEISALGIPRQNAAYYTVHVAIPAGSAPLGASASVYLPKE